MSLIQINKAIMASYPILEIEYSDGARRRYDVSSWVGQQAWSQVWADPASAFQFKVQDRGRELAWRNGVTLDSFNLRYYKHDLDVHEWRDVPDTVLPAERMEMAKRNLPGRGTIIINPEQEVTPSEYARRKGITMQAVSMAIRRGQLKNVRYIPELGLTLIPVEQDAA